jgi:hypothetical protein
MPTPVSVGNTAFRVFSIDETISLDGLDTLTVVRRGAASGLAVERNAWRRGQKYPGYPNMYLQTINSVDRGPVVDVTLTFSGFINALDSNNGIVDISDDIAEESVTITTSTGENVTFRYFAQTTTTRWMSRGAQSPSRPRFPAVVPTSLPIGLLRQPNPPNYTGSKAGSYKLEGVLAGFQRVRLAPGVWAVVESWKNLVEPINPNE